MQSLDRLRIAPTREFLDRIFSVDPRILDEVCRRVQQEGHALLPVATDICTAFVKVANEIASVARIVAGTNEDQVYESTWVDYRHESSQSRGSKTATVKPACALVMPYMRAVLDDPSSSVEETLKERFWWLQPVAAVHVKRDSLQDDRLDLLRLLNHLRLIMAVQRDRRFTFGLLLQGTQVSVWLQDRSGVLGIDSPIDIHESPRDFVRVMAALVILPAHRLGFDPTMRLAREPSSPIHTYRLSEAPNQFMSELYRKNDYATEWVITIGERTFLTLRAMNVPCVESIVGSGFMVWAVIRYSDRDQDTNRREVFMLKQWWKSEGQADEGPIYESLRDIQVNTVDTDAQYIGEMHCYEATTIDHEVDDTADLIQGGLESTPLALETGCAGGKKRRPAEEEEDIGFGDHVPIVTEDDLVQSVASANEEQPRKRTRMRIILKDFGCSIAFFATLQELLTCLMDGVRGHRFTYTHGILQGDVNIENLQITLGHPEASQSRPQRVRGRLVNFHHAKRIAPVSQRIIKSDVENIPLLPMYHPMRANPSLKVTEAVVQRGLHAVKLRYPKRPTGAYMTFVDDYIRAAVHYYEVSGNASPSDTVYTPELFGWDTQMLEPPTAFDPTLEQDLPPTRTVRAPAATPPFASAMILNRDVINVARPAWVSPVPTAVVHDALHDMESFFWVLLYLCITRSGPGNQRRSKLFGDIEAQPDPDQAAELQATVHAYFDGSWEEIARSKRELFENSECFEARVLRHVHPYFDPLKPLLRRWWELLLLAYEFQGYEYHGIHKFVLALLEQTLRDLPPKNSPDDIERARIAVKERTEFVRTATYADSIVDALQAQPNSLLPCTGELRVSTAFDDARKSQEREPIDGSGRHTPPPSPPSLSPAAKKARR
ncbi:hypothetical protein HDZ31DRAFT_42849 [Schizophyllum fasciatum]